MTAKTQESPMRTSTTIAVATTSVFLRVGLPLLGAAFGLAYGVIPAALTIAR